MSPHEWLSSGQWALAAAAAALIWLFSTGRMLGTLQTKFEGRVDAVDTHLELVDRRLGVLEDDAAKTDAAIASAVSEARLVNGRMDQAGELLSDLTGKIQAMPTQEAVTALWREMTRLQEEQRDGIRSRAHLAERIASLEGEQHGRRA